MFWVFWSDIWEFFFWKVKKTTRYVFKIVHPQMEGPFSGGREGWAGMNSICLRCQGARETVDSPPLPDCGGLSGG